ncbi:PAS domain S-box-containing protein/diguanylate cyclase (GGDEF) domain-containing protein [Blastococcus haudaquaticus]|uniref:PAS domain S-box-containing protein/diguanylate cyclase (GGDEF) domain-containing protein n=1 Tax=Blastococcus haudaquaticus TaxID=1938745 RepID=A0A286GJL8_9ACTN|nr:PAS domain S-box-containing protein/diguanylate cyclase (GGDEF) domain-containing protein [Blastococcus haudaquaticus]
MLDGVPDAVYRLDAQGRFTYLNAAAEGLFRRRADELIGRSMVECFPMLEGTPAEKLLHEVLATAEPRQFDHYAEQRDRWFEVRAFPDAEGIAVFFRDVDAQHRAAQRRETALRELTAVLEALPSATVLVDEDGRILITNRAWEANSELLRSSGIDPGGLDDDYLECLRRGLPGDDQAAVAAGLARLQAEPLDGLPGSFDHEYSAQLGSFATWFRLQAARVPDSRRVVVTHTDITERVRGEQALAWRAGHDELTGLPNRATLLDMIADALAHGTPDAPGTALLVLDLDGFKTVNDSLGHQIGDRLLRQVGERLAEQVRPGDAVGRLGADQFVVLARSCDQAEAAALAFRLQSTFALPFTASGISVPLSASIGVAVSRSDVRDPHQLLSDADAAMFAAKSSGRDRVHLFSPGLREAARWRLEVATRLRGDAIDQLVVHYQPVVRLDTGEVEGVEALVRWQHPERGLLPPDSFLSVAEETGQVIPITRWLLRETTRKAAEWAAQGLPLRMSVNISARHFSAETLVRDVRVALRDSGLPPDQLVLELTETSVAEDPTRAEDQLTVLRSFGVRVAIDDFGTGWSSLAQLFALPIGTLKIDRSLLNAAERAVAGETGAVLHAIVELTRTLGIRSVAEGVETPEHLRMVREAGCDLAQGWLLGQAMPAEEIPRFVRSVQAAGGDLCALAVAGASVPQAG